MDEEQEPQPMIYGQYAGFVTRLLAFSIDLILIILIMSLNGYVIRFIASFVVALPGVPDIPWLKEATLATTTAVNLALIVAYYVGFWLAAGQTPGKRFIGVRIVRTDGGRVRVQNALRRFVGYFLSLILFLGFLWILVDNQRQGWHDTLAGTLVIYSRPKPLQVVILPRKKSKAADEAAA